MCNLSYERAMATEAAPGYHASPWPGEDGGPARRVVPRARGLGLTPGERLVATSRPCPIANMVVLREPGEVFLQGSTSPGPDGAAFVERVHPESLETLARSPDLPAGGQWWPGGIAAHRNGYLYVTHGRFCHQLDPDLRVVASRELPREAPYNSLLILSDGTLVMKDLQRAPARESAFVALDPDGLRQIGPEVVIPEPSVARISAECDPVAGDVVYAVGDRRVFRFRWRDGALVRDADWAPTYRTAPDDQQQFGWDAVLVDGAAWFMDNGSNDFAGSFRGRGHARGPLHLVRASLRDPADVRCEVPFGLAHGTIVNPPLVEPRRRIVVAFDSGNDRVAGFRYGDGPGLVRLWEHAFGTSSHFICWPDTGEIMVNDHRDDAGDHAVVLDVESGEERGRVAVQSPLQSAVFPAAGFGRDLYWCSFSTVARVAVG